ncbi:globin domain-containing protein [uncultured Sphingomonas sp.]|uniref:globin domain-containing protein n=1 Tax=uncultured Sphingomonas sp. TaxID=158754 RepID=UPI0025D2B69C|nr:globin domain-containing protein [uncultured Sphingomonas sp.]
MHARQIDRIRDSFVLVLFDPDRAAKLFYDRLFELEPETRTLFSRDMEEQGRTLIRTLAIVVTGLSRLDAMIPTLSDLAIRHVRYGVERHHYAAVGVAIIDMLDVVCADDFDADTRASWSEAYRLIADAMIAAAYPPTQDLVGS